MKSVLKIFQASVPFFSFWQIKKRKIKKIKCHMVRPKLYWKTLDLAVNIPHRKTALAYSSMEQHILDTNAEKQLSYAATEI
jgi:hypothetical protein